MTYKTIGHHIIADFWGIDFDKLNDIEFLENHLTSAAARSGAHILATEAKKFTPIGATVILLLSESHLSIHTYPEKGYAAVDGFTCGNTIQPEVAITYLHSVLAPQKSYIKKITRGSGELFFEDLPFGTD